jgi:hypothetical protein
MVRGRATCVHEAGARWYAACIRRRGNFYLAPETRSSMSPRSHAQGTSWRLVISLAGLWLAAAIVLAAVAAPANAVQSAPATTAATAGARVQPAGQRPEAPLITVLLAGGAVATVAIRSRGVRGQPARQAVRIR